MGISGLLHRPNALVFYASSSDGGFGLASILGLYIQATARELMVLLLGESEASLVARETVRRLMSDGGGVRFGSAPSGFLLQMRRVFSLPWGGHLSRNVIDFPGELRRRSHASLAYARTRCSESPRGVSSGSLTYHY